MHLETLNVVIMWYILFNLITVVAVVGDEFFIVLMIRLSLVCSMVAYTARLYRCVALRTTGDKGLRNKCTSF